MSDDYDTDETLLDEINSTLQSIQALLEARNRPSSSGAGSWLVAIFMFSFLLSWTGSNLDKWTDKAWYSFKYETDFKNIAIDRRPLDCNFFHAPLGGKGCDYKKQLETYGPKERNAMSHDATTPELKRFYEQLPNSVIVHWDKEED